MAHRSDKVAARRRKKMNVLKGLLHRRREKRKKKKRKLAEVFANEASNSAERVAHAAHTDQVKQIPCQLSKTQCSEAKDPETVDKGAMENRIKLKETLTNGSFKRAEHKLKEDFVLQTSFNQDQSVKTNVSDVPNELKKEKKKKSVEQAAVGKSSGNMNLTNSFSQSNGLDCSGEIATAAETKKKRKKKNRNQAVSNDFKGSEVLLSDSKLVSTSSESSTAIGSMGSNGKNVELNTETKKKIKNIQIAGTLLKNFNGFEQLLTDSVSNFPESSIARSFNSLASNGRGVDSQVTQQKKKKKKRKRAETLSDDLHQSVPTDSELHSNSSESANSNSLLSSMKSHPGDFELQSTKKKEEEE